MIYFTGYGYRAVKQWKCTVCNNFFTCGMDLTVDESIREHQKKCSRVEIRIVTTNVQDALEQAIKEIQAIPVEAWVNGAGLITTFDATNAIRKLIVKLGGKI